MKKDDREQAQALDGVSGLAALAAPQAQLAKLHALAQETRLSAFRLLVRQGVKGLPAGEIAEALDVNGSTLSRHLGVLERAGLVTARREARRIIYSADYGGMRDLFGFLREDCCSNDPHCIPDAIVVRLREDDI